jgi:hypothetical protein
VVELALFAWWMSIGHKVLSVFDVEPPTGSLGDDGTWTMTVGHGLPSPKQPVATAS